MADIPCLQVTLCDTPDDYVNVSAEAPDLNPYIGIQFGDPQFPPAIGSDWRTNSCLGVCESTVSQADANRCAANAQILCVSHNGSGGDGHSPASPPGTPGAGDPGTGGPPTVPGQPFGGTDPDTPSGTTPTGTPTIPTPGGTTPPGEKVFYSKPVTAAASCPDGTTSFYTVPAGYFVSRVSQAAADNAAISMAPGLAAQNLTCPCHIPVHACAGQLYAATCSPRSPNMRLPLSFSGSGMPPGIEVSGGGADGNNSAIIKGVCTIPQNYGSKLIITDSLGNSSEKDIEIDVMGLTNGAMLPDPDSPSGASMKLQPAKCGEAYTMQLNAEGFGHKGCTFELDPEESPAWLTMNESGMITGTPTIDDSGIKFYFDVVLRRPDGFSCRQTVYITVTCCFKSGQPPDAVICSAYNFTFEARPGGLQYTGDVPNGLTLDPNTGVVSGAIRRANNGTADFTITATDPNNEDIKCTKKWTIQVTGGDGIAKAVSEMGAWPITYAQDPDTGAASTSGGPNNGSFNLAAYGKMYGTFRRIWKVGLERCAADADYAVTASIQVRFYNVADPGSNNNPITPRLSLGFVVLGQQVLSVVSGVDRSYSGSLTIPSVPINGTVDNCYVDLQIGSGVALDVGDFAALVQVSITPENPPH